ncbi:hypothetical protein O181_106074 [Austropuccinia psidii MF-1]|uniref:Endonuclease/exonuclease/phosphatase domain-containing protein n=1 Tax=Austropuccinia psidii MF-1 TaxID=1389203 RepID=A0A9Q3PLP9_9BASI|nr:hypothetical protein [Austropuccinia psidii MF-1]
MMDSNLHHPLWNPHRYTHTHTQATELIKACRKKGFHLISPKHSPAFLGVVGRPTTIDLTWVNHITQRLPPSTQIQLNNHSSNHHLIITKIILPNSETCIPTTHLSIHLKDFDNMLFLCTLKRNLTQETTTKDSIETITQNISAAITMAYNDQVKWVTTNPTRSKAWWNKEKLNSLVRLGNQAIRKMLKHQTNKYNEEYYHYQQLLKQKVWELKSSHWIKFLAKRGPEHAYQAYKFTNDRQEDATISPKNQEGNLISKITEKASLIFYGTLTVETTANLDNIPQQQHPASLKLQRMKS